MVIKMNYKLFFYYTTLLALFILVFANELNFIPNKKNVQLHTLKEIHLEPLPFVYSFFNNQTKDKKDGKKLITNPSNLYVMVNKQYNLPDNYIPSNIVKPNVLFSYNGDLEKNHLRIDASIALEKLFAKAESCDYKFYLVSGYRSYNRQVEVFNSNKNKYGFDIANQTSAIPGESEHQTGLAVDVSVEKINFQLSEKLAVTDEWKWLEKNAHLYGFIIRYPMDKVNITKYEFEPWHLRYVGIELSTYLYQHNLTLEELFNTKKESN